MLKSPIAGWMLTIAVLLFGNGVASGQSYPTKPIRIIAAEVGGGADVVARIVANSMSVPLGQPVIVENRPASLNGEMVAKATPDGYTLLLASSTFIFAPLFRKEPYDPVKDFSPITMLAKAPNIIVVHPSVPVNSVKELIALAKAKPGVLNYASGGAGSSIHLAGELFKNMAGVDIVRVAYRGSGPALNALLGGQVQVMFATAASAAPHLKSGKLKALAVTGHQPSALVPGLPTVTASGVPGYEFEALYAISAPAKVPAAVIKRLNNDLVRVLNQADFKEKFLNSGVEAAPSSPTELATVIKSEIVKIGKLIKDANIRAD